MVNTASLLARKKPLNCVKFREFPPFCGRDAPCPTEEERLMLMTGKYQTRYQQLNKIAAGDEFFRKRKLADSDNSPMREKTSGSSGENLVSQANQSNLGSQGNQPNLVSQANQSNLVSQANQSSLTRGALDVGVPNTDRDKVMKTLARFQALCHEILQSEAAQVGQQERVRLRVDLKAATMMRETKREINAEQRIGEVPGVQVGDQFTYRVELVIIGLHRLHQAGIEYMKLGGRILATSIIASATEGYSDDLANPDELIYSGQGGNLAGRNNKQPEDQKLERGNLALMNCISARTHVRVTRGFQTSGTARAKLVMYTYDGLYTVEKYWRELGNHQKYVYKFQLKRVPGQPKVAWNRIR